MLSLLTLLVDQGWQVSFASPAQLGEHKVDLTKLGIVEKSIVLNCASFDNYISELNPDVVLFDRFMLEEQFGWRVAQQCPDALRILDTEDLHFLRHARHIAHKQGRKLLDSDLKSELAQREVAAIFRSDLSLIISDFELNLLSRSFSVPKHILHHCPFMLDLSHLTKETPTYTQRQHFISIGNFRHAPNWDAVLWLKQEIWPLIRKQMPEAELHIYGAYPPQKATQLHQPKNGFLVKGWAEDARQVMQQARVCIAPLRFGAGIKGKLAEAMYCGTPNVTTSIGIEGMHGGLPWPGEVADSAEDIAEAAMGLYQGQNTWLEQQHRGYDLLEQNFDHKRLAPLLLSRVLQLKEELTSHRSNNFIGSMLRHHHHASTQYMAQWIAAKNRI
jgi:glycosyltransferase involved in cell wall biosynthesis